MIKCFQLFYKDRSGIIYCCTVSYIFCVKISEIEFLFIYKKKQINFLCLLLERYVGNLYDSFKLSGHFYFRDTITLHEGNFTTAFMW